MKQENMFVVWDVKEDRPSGILFFTKGQAQDSANWSNQCYPDRMIRFIVRAVTVEVNQ
jgi:hypothetical protein